MFTCFAAVNVCSKKPDEAHEPECQHDINPAIVVIGEEKGSVKFGVESVEWGV